MCTVCTVYILCIVCTMCAMLCKVALEQAFRSFDFNNSGQITAKEWLLGMAIMRKGSITHRLKLLFNAFDADG